MFNSIGCPTVIMSRCITLDHLRTCVELEVWQDQNAGLKKVGNSEGPTNVNLCNVSNVCHIVVESKFPRNEISGLLARCVKKDSAELLNELGRNTGSSAGD